MSTRDSHFSFIHLEDPNHVLHMEKWQDNPIPFDDIDTQALFDATANLFPQYLLEEEEDGGIPISSSTIGAKIIKDRKLLKDRTWQDLGIFDRFLEESAPKRRDETILKSVYTKLHNPVYDVDNEHPELTMAEFLSSGYEVDMVDEHEISSSDIVNDSIMGNTGDLSLTSSDLLGPSGNFSMNVRSSSVNSNAVQTPRPPRTRQLSTDRNFQTPITRIIR